MSAATSTGSTFTLRDAGGNLIAATVSFNAATNTATLDPSESLANSATYTARISSGASGVKDLAGNPLAGDFVWSFTTAAAIPPTVTVV